MKIRWVYVVVPVVVIAGLVLYNRTGRESDTVSTEGLRDDTVEENTVELADIARRSGVVSTASGLLYEVTRGVEGSRSPSASDVVKVHYEGSLLTGEVFDSSYGRGVPASFPLNQVIPGWTEGVQYMKVGEEFIFYIPSHLAYGERGVPGVIPPNSDLVFKVELLGIE